MSQRIHSCANNLHIDPVNCEAYSHKLQHRRKNEPPAAGSPRVATHSKRSSSRTRSVGQVPLQQSQTQRSKTTNVRRQQNELKQETLKSEPTAASVIHRELYTDNPALVEVTVKTHNTTDRHSKLSNGSGKRETWGKLLTKQSSYESVSSFHNFDPLRTLHFLVKELQNKLLDSLPNDKNVQQMVHDLQVTLGRIPPDIASSVALQGDTPDKLPATKSSSGDEKPSLRSEVDDYPIHVVKPAAVDRSCQTSRNYYAETEKLQKHLEESSAKIETACKQMENVCTRLKSEKEELEIMLRAEKETVKFLRKQLEECENEKNELLNAKTAVLQQERDAFQTQAMKLKAKLDSYQTDSSNEELKSLVDELKRQRAATNEQMSVLNHQIMILTMEKEKYVAILAARDRQIKEIRAEMSQLQEVVREQMAELRNAPSSIASSATDEWLARLNLLEKTYAEPSRYEASDRASAATSFQGGEANNAAEATDAAGSNTQERLQRSQEAKANYAVYNVHEKRDRKDRFDMNSIRSMFAEIKKQALMVTSGVDRSEDDLYDG